MYLKKKYNAIIFIKTILKINCLLKFFYNLQYSLDFEPLRVHLMT